MNVKRAMHFLLLLAVSISLIACGQILERVGPSPLVSDPMLTGTGPSLLASDPILAGVDPSLRASSPTLERVCPSLLASFLSLALACPSLLTFGLTLATGGSQLHGTLDIGLEWSTSDLQRTKFVPVHWSLGHSRCAK